MFSAMAVVESIIAVAVASILVFILYSSLGIIADASAVVKRVHASPSSYHLLVGAGGSHEIQ